MQQITWPALAQLQLNLLQYCLVSIFDTSFNKSTVP